MKNKNETLNHNQDNVFDNKNNFKLNQDEFLYYKNHKLLKEYNLTDKEIKREIVFLKKIIDEYNICNNSNSDLCPFNGIHSSFWRAENGFLMHEAIFCFKQKLNFLKNKYKEYILYNNLNNLEFSNEMLNEEFRKKNNYKASRSKVNLINKFKEIFQNNLFKGVYVYGDCQIGKTYYFTILSNSVAYFYKKKVSLVNIPKLVKEIKESWNNKEIIDKIKNDINNIIISDAVFFDDLGAEYVSEWFYSDYFLEILDARNSSNKFTFFNSNFSLDNYFKFIKNRFKKNSNQSEYIANRIVSRIKGLVCDFIELKK